MTVTSYTQGVMMVALTCCHQDCGMTFAVPSWWENARRRDHAWWYCPKGHSQHFAGQSETEKLRVELATQERATNRERAAAERLRMERDAEARRGAAARGQVTKLKRRAERGVCFHCNRSFPDLADHMQSKHAHLIDVR
jgi:hypothetical protein